jgi:HEAT repeat protein
MRDEDYTLFTAVEKTLVRIGTPALETLLVALHDKDGELRRRVVTVLGEIGNPVALPSLLDMLSEEQNVHVRTEVVRVLRVFDDATVIPHIIKALKD